jgi:hypothetical protein
MIAAGGDRSAVSDLLRQACDLRLLFYSQFKPNPVRAGFKEGRLPDRGPGAGEV